MFGYIRPKVSELRVRELEQYRAVYCGLCHALSRRYGLPARFVLNYDLTFFALHALSDGCPGFRRCRCPFRPFGRHHCVCAMDRLDDAADMSVLLFYYKLLDGIADARGLRRLAARLIKPLFSFLHRRAARLAPELEAAAAAYFAAQRAAEEKRAGPDEAAEPTAKLLAALFPRCAKDETGRRVLARYGYFLGRWVYFTDAADDLERDRKSENYNPFLAEKKETASGEARGRAGMFLNSSAFELAAAYELLPKGCFSPILENILYLGMPLTQKNVLSGKNSTGKQFRERI